MTRTTQTAAPGAAESALPAFDQEVAFGFLSIGSVLYAMDVLRGPPLALECVRLRKHIVAVRAAFEQLSPRAKADDLPF